MWIRQYGGIPPFLAAADKGVYLSIAALVNLASYFDSQQMDTLSRREEEVLLKATKAKALKECDSVVKGKSA